MEALSQNLKERLNNEVRQFIEERQYEPVDYYTKRDLANRLQQYVFSGLIRGFEINIDEFGQFDVLIHPLEPIKAIPVVSMEDEITAILAADISNEIDAMIVNQLLHDYDGDTMSETIYPEMPDALAITLKI